MHIWNLPPGSEDTSSVTPLTFSYFPGEDQREITCLDWSPDGKLVATGAIDGRLRLCTASAELYLENAHHPVGIRHKKGVHEWLIVLRNSKQSSLSNSRRQANGFSSEDSIR